MWCFIHNLYLIGGLYGRHTVTAASRPTGAIKTASRSPPPSAARSGESGETIEPEEDP